MSVRVVWHSGENTPERQDAAWFVERDSSHTLIARVTDDETEQSVGIYVDGEMSVAVYPDEDSARAGGEPLGYLFWADQLAGYGITNDTELAAERLVWDGNAWFDLYDGEHGDHLDQVCHSISDALAQARRALAETRAAMDDALDPYRYV